MRSTFIRRLDEIEARETDWASKLDIVDYIGLCNYADGSWVEIHFDEILTVLRNKVSGEVPGLRPAGFPDWPGLNTIDC